MTVATSTLDPKAVGKCRGCGKTILWGETPDGKKIPLDFAAPIYAASLMTHGSVAIELLKSPDRKDALKRGDANVVAVSHFATCPKADEFSGGRS